MDAKGEEIGGGMDWEFGINRYKHLYTELIKVLLYSTGYIQYLVINHNGNKIKKNAYMYN